MPLSWGASTVPEEVPPMQYNLLYLDLRRSFIRYRNYQCNEWIGGRPPHLDLISRLLNAGSLCANLYEFS